VHDRFVPLNSLIGRPLYSLQVLSADLQEALRIKKSLADALGQNQPICCVNTLAMWWDVRFIFLFSFSCVYRTSSFMRTNIRLPVVRLPYAVHSFNVSPSKTLHMRLRMLHVSPYLRISILSTLSLFLGYSMAQTIQDGDCSSSLPEACC
jgi:hypothetical protein